MKKVFCFIVILTLLGCIGKKVPNYYFYNTKEYLTKEKTLNINTEQASLIFAKNYFQDNPTEEQVTAYLDIIYNDYYVFSHHWFLSNPKTGDYFFKKSYWINGKTKEIKKIDNGKLKILIKIPKVPFVKEIKKR